MASDDGMMGPRLSIDTNGHDPFIAQPTTTNLRTQLQALLDEKEQQLARAGALGQQLLSQQVELNERIVALERYEHIASSGSRTPDPDGDPELRQKLTELSEALQSWDNDNEKIWTGIAAGGARSINGPPSSLPPASARTPDGSPNRDVFRDLPPEPQPDYSTDASVSKGPSAAQASRRAKNAAHRQDDVKFAYDIGTSLLTEVRRLQSLLSERDKTIQDMKADKDDLEKENDLLRTNLRQQEEAADRFKEENWNLEVKIQEAQAALNETQQTAASAELKVKQTTRQLIQAQQAAENHKSEHEKVTVQYEELKTKHDTDVAQFRKQTAAMNREKSDLQASVDNLKTEMAKRERMIGKNRFGSPLANNNPPAEVSTPTNYHNDEDLFASALASRRKLDAPGSAFLTPGHAYDFDASPEPSPTKPGIVLAPNHPSNELETLRQALSHAHRQINTLKSTVQREKEQKLQFKKQLAKEGLLNASVPGAWEDEEVDEDDVEKSPPRAAPSTRGRHRPTRGRGAKILSLAQKLGLASVERHAASNGDWEDAPSPPTSPPGNDLLDEEVEGGHDEQEEPSPFVVPSRPTSVDGMDPAFANVLKQMPGGSPLRPSPLAGQRDPVSPSPQPAAAGKKSRGGSAFKRPTSLAGPPASSLGAELGGDTGDDTTLQQPTSAVLEELEEEMPTMVVAKETSEMSTQTDPEEPPAPIKEIVKEVVKEIVTVEVPVEVPVRVEVPVPVPVVKPETAESAMQTDEPEPVPEPAPTFVATYAEEGVATDSEPETVLPPRKVMAEADVQTDVEPEEIEIPIQSAGPVADVELRSMVISREEVELPSNRVTVPFPIRTTELGAEVVTDDDTTMPARTPRILSMASTKTARPVGMIFEEADAETETDGEFLDARESMAAMTPTPADSLSDFHSAHDGPAPSESEHSDAGSIRASKMAVRERYASLTAQGRRISQTSRTIPIVQPAPPKPELKDEGIQTDEWSPAPIFLPVPPSPARSFHRVGTTSNAPPFQFVSTPQRPDMSFTSSVGTVTPTQAMLAAPTATRSLFRDSGATFGSTSAPRSSTPSMVGRQDRRQSMESSLSSAAPIAPEDGPGVTRSQILAVPSPPVDRTKPPVMMMPPPPPMPPPSSIPVRTKTPSGGPPPRPTSPPPPELIQRATTPTFRSNTPSLHVPGSGRGFGRPHNASLPPNAQGLDLRPSTSSFRSAPGAHQNGLRSPIAGVFDPPRRELSTTSLLSGVSSAVASRRASVSSSRSSEVHHQMHQPQARTPGRPATTVPTAPVTPASGQAGESSEGDVIHAITQTMIGEFMYKYTRRVVGRGHGEKRHRRFFWIHPYTKTLYWSSGDPGSAGANESTAKSAYVESVKAIMDPNPLPPGVYQYSIVVSTPQREMKFTAPNKERHDIWYTALKYLLDRPSTIPVNDVNGGQPSRPLTSPHQRKFSSEDGNHGNVMTSPRSVRSIHSTHSYSITPRAMRSQTQLSVQSSIGKRPGTPAAEYLRWAEEAQKSPTRSVRSYRQGAGYADDDDDYEAIDPAGELSFELHDEGFEAMENVRACCDGEHDLGTLSRRPGSRQHHHHHHHHHNGPVGNLSRPQTPAERPTSPSGWSFRSKTSGHSEGGSRLSQWAADTKRSIRFTNRGKSPATRPSLNIPRTNN